MTRSKLFWLHGLFGDDILITRQQFVFSEKDVICFSYKSHDFAHLCAHLCAHLRYEVWTCSMISMKILFHMWNLILFKGQKYHQGSLAYFIFV